MRKVVKAVIPAPVFRLVEPYGHWLEAVMANFKYKFPAKDLKIIGVTGTDGKTTTATIITSMLRQAGFKVGMMTTISIDLGDGPKPNPTRLTTITAFDLQKNLAKMKAAKLDWVVLETTSHALAQNRTWGIPYSVGVMTNVTHEHLDYHRTFERYRDAKFKLFKLVGRNPNGLDVGVVNADDESGELFASVVKRPIRYGVKHGDLKASKIKISPKGSTFHAKFGEQEFDINLKIPGSFNVYNALAAIGAGVALDLTEKQIEKGIAAVESVEGRMNTVDEGQDFTVIVDYAHTPQSFEKILKEMRPLTTGQMIVVFGSAGRRDEAKRPLQGEVAGKMADVVIITEEDDRDIDGQQIMEEIAVGAELAGKKRDINLYLIHDRREAIEAAIMNAQKGDTVLLLGKGHEKSILGPSGKRPWDEIAEAKRALKKR